MLRTRRRIPVALLLGLLPSACGSPQETPAVADMAMAMVDKGPGWLDLEGRIIGIDEVGLAGVDVSLCKSKDCKMVRTGAQGEFAFAKVTFDFYTLRVRKGVATDYATLDFPLYVLEGFNPRLTALLLPKVGAGSPLMVGQQTVVVDASLSITLDSTLLKGPDGAAVTQLAGLRVPRALQPNFCIPGATVLATWAFAPTNVISSSPMPVTLRETFGQKPGDALSFLEIDSDGRPSVVATGRVSPDGKTVETLMNAGLRKLGWLVVAVVFGGP